ncbi:unnamed protein product [Ixodes persulcatus]
MQIPSFVGSVFKTLYLMGFARISSQCFGEMLFLDCSFHVHECFLCTSTTFRERKEKGDQGTGAVPKFLLERPAITAKDLEGKTEEEKEMMKIMGFGSFDSSKGKHIPGNNVYAVHVIHKRKYRQYMNRKGGFNRPLDYVA